MDFAFLAVMSRMKTIRRWALMRNTSPENICEHSYDVAVLSHGLALLSNARFGTNYDVEKCVMLALYHDAPEIFTGDLPTPVKYKTGQMEQAYRCLEESAAEQLAEMVPQELREEYRQLLMPDTDTAEYRLMKAADKLSALIKCEEELVQGNREFNSARQAQEDALRALPIPVVGYFLDNCLPAYRMTLDEQRRGGEGSI